MDDFQSSAHDISGPLHNDERDSWWTTGISVFGIVSQPWIPCAVTAEVTGFHVSRVLKYDEREPRAQFMLRLPLTSTVVYSPKCILHLLSAHNIRPVYFSALPPAIAVQYGDAERGCWRLMHAGLRHVARWS